MLPKLLKQKKIGAAELVGVGQMLAKVILRPLAPLFACVSRSAIFTAEVENAAT
jgi:hypothetical protein